MESGQATHSSSRLWHPMVAAEKFNKRNHLEIEEKLQADQSNFSGEKGRKDTIIQEGKQTVNYSNCLNRWLFLIYWHFQEKIGNLKRIDICRFKFK